LLIKPELAANVLTLWDSEDWPGLTQDEKNLMSVQDGLPLWRTFSKFPDDVIRIIRYWTLQMVDGMTRLMDYNHPPNFVKYHNIEVLAGEKDYNHYCYIVAGTVGNLVTQLVILHYHLSDPVAKHLLSYCEACGRGLQKTNIIKDFREDLTRGICYLPNEWLSEVSHAPLFLEGASSDWKRKVIDNALVELKDATDYTMNLPYEAVGYRMASLLCLLPALQTILLATQNLRILFTAQHTLKISKQTFMQCILDAKKLSKDNQEILEYFKQLENIMDLEFSKVKV
jgi:farnesyl-diphosphate farnesyltransferase